MPISNPYVGPRTFTRDNSNLFFGRNQEAKDLLAVVLTNRLTLFYAQSGAGKSSLVNTRLIPDIQKEGFLTLPVGRVSGQLLQGITSVDNIFVFNLLISLDQSKTDPARLSNLTISQFLANLTTEDGELYVYNPEEKPEAHETAVSPEEEYAPVPHLLIIDQFEEIITTNLDHWPEREAFFQQLNQAILDDPMLWVLLTLREDFVAGLRPYANLMHNNMRARYYMQRMEEPAALSAVEEPARLGERPFAPGVAKILVDNLRQIKVQGEEITQPGQFIEPVQLQVVCYQLWQEIAQTDKKEISEQDLQELGNVDKALAEFYETTIANAIYQTGVSEIILRDWFDKELITEAETRGTVYQGQHETAGMANVVVKALADQYLLRAEIRAGAAWYELVHDRFVAPILQANQEWRLQQGPLIRAAQEWDRAGRSRDKLYKEDQLHEALASVANLETTVQIVIDFLQASQDAQSQRDLERAQLEMAEQTRRAEAEAATSHRLRRLTRSLIVAIGVACIFAIIAFIFAMQTRDQRDTAVASGNAQATLAAENGLLAAANLEKSIANEYLAATSIAAAATSEAISLENAALADAAATSEAQAKASAELATYAFAELQVQSLVLNHQFAEAVTEAETILEPFNGDITPEEIVARAMINVGPFYTFNQLAQPVVKINTALAILDKALAIDPNLAKVPEDRLSNLAQVYINMCRPVVSSETLTAEAQATYLLVCERAVTLAAELDLGALNLQICPFTDAKPIEELAEQLTAVCNHVQEQAQPLTANEVITSFIEPNKRDLYLFDSPGNQTIYLFMFADNSQLDSYLELYAADGEFLLYDDQNGGQNNAYLVFTVPNPGPYIVIARGWNNETEGDYQLVYSDQPIDTYATIAQENLQIGQTIQSSITPGETELFSFTGEENQRVIIRMNAAANSSLDSYLALSGPYNSYLSEDNDSGGGLNAAITVTLPYSGTYLVSARDVNPEAGGGTYSLSVEAEEVASISEIENLPEEALGELRPGEPVEALLEPGERHLWQFTGEENQSVSLAMFSPDDLLDGYLLLLDPDGVLIAENDDGLGNRNPIITTQLPTTGVYSVIARGFSDSASGNYLLEWADGSAGFSFNGEITAVQDIPTVQFRVMGELTAGQPVTDTILTGQNHFWTFNGTAGDSLTILMRATNSPLDSYLELVDPMGVIVAQNDDGGGNLDSLIEAYTLSMTGIYTVIAQGYNEDSSGAYNLLLSKE